MMIIKLMVMVLTCSASPLSPDSPELDQYKYQLMGETQIFFQPRSKRSITAFLAAEVLLLERILAARNSKKAGAKAKAKKVARPVFNQIHTPGHGKHNDIHIPTYLPPVKQHKTKPTTTRPISQLDPFVMLTAPDLSKNHASTQNSFPIHKDPIIYELLQTPAQPGSKREAKQYPNYISKYGEFELYNPKMFEQKSTLKTFEIATSPSQTVKVYSDRKPRKITPKYGAFELYQPVYNRSNK